MRRPLFIAALVLGGCRAQQSYDDPIPPDDVFPVAAASGAELARYRDAADYSDQRNGLALLVISSGTLVFEHYSDKWSAERPHHLFSGTKSFSCAIALAAEEQGILDLDEPVADTITEWQGDAEKEAITIRQLLSFTSGLDKDWFALTRDGLVEQQRIEDKYAHALDLAVVTPPGEHFEYSSTHLMVFGEVITRKTGTDPLSYLEEQILDPIGLRTAGWNHDPAGNPMLPYGAWTTAYEWAKYGVLVADDGAWQGTQVLPSTRFDRCTVGSAANPGYGLTWWLNREVGSDVDLSAFGSLSSEGAIIVPDGPADLFAAAGYGDQRLYIVPSSGLVVVRLADGSRRYRDAELLTRLLGL